MDAIGVLQRRGLILPAIAALTACSGGGYDEPATGAGSLSLALSDAPVSGVEQVVVQFDGVTLRRNGDAPIEISFDPPIVVDLLTLTSDDPKMLLDGEQVPAGFYEQIALHVQAEHDGTLDSYVVTTGGGQEEIFVPSGTQTGLKLVDGVTITADQETRFFIDWDVRLALVDPPGLPGWILRPTLRVMTEFGTLAGTVDPSLVMAPSICQNDLTADSGNAVYIYEQFDFSMQAPDDIDGMVGPTPIATAAVTQDASGIYSYEVFLSPGEYTVAFTCQADAEAGGDEDIAFVGTTDATILNGATTDVNFVFEQ